MKFGCKPANLFRLLAFGRAELCLLIVCGDWKKCRVPYRALPGALRVLTEPSLVLTEPSLVLTEPSLADLQTANLNMPQ
jgi:hypothetical protein